MGRRDGEAQAYTQDAYAQDADGEDADGEDADGRDAGGVQHSRVPGAIGCDARDGGNRLNMRVSSVGMQSGIVAYGGCPACGWSAADFREAHAIGLDPVGPGDHGAKQGGADQDIQQRAGADRAEQDGEQEGGGDGADLADGRREARRRCRGISVGNTSPASR